MRPWIEKKNEFIIYTFTPSSNFEFSDHHIPLFDEASQANSQDKEWAGIVCFDEKLLNSKLALEMNNNHFVETEAFISVFKELPFGI